MKKLCQILMLMTATRLLGMSKWSDAFLGLVRAVRKALD